MNDITPNKGKDCWRILKNKTKQNSQDSVICCLQEIYFKHKDTERPRVKEGRETAHVNINQRKAKVTI